MILKTIINCNSHSFTRALLFSLGVHVVTWAFIPDEWVRFQPSSEHFITQKLEQVPDQFIMVIAAPAVEEPAQVEVKPEPKPQPVEKARARATTKSKRKVTRRQKPKAETKPTPEPQPAPTPEPLMASVAQTMNDAVVAPTSTTIAQASEASDTQARADRDHSESSEPAHTATRLSKNELKGILKGYYRSLNELMRGHRVYPRAARRLGLEGTVLVELVVDQKGLITSVKIARSSGHQQLDQAALSQVTQMKRVPQFPREIKRSKMTFTINFDYSLQS